MESDLIKDWEKFSLMEEEEIVVGSGENADLGVGSNDQIHLALVGKLCTFFKKEDKEKIMEGRPWFFDGKLLLLGDIQGGEQPSEIEFFSSPMWIRLFDVPFNRRCASFMFDLGESLDEVTKEVHPKAREAKLALVFDVANNKEVLRPRGLIDSVTDPLPEGINKALDVAMAGVKDNGAGKSISVKGGKNKTQRTWKRVARMEEGYRGRGAADHKGGNGGEGGGKRGGSNMVIHDQTCKRRKGALEFITRSSINKVEGSGGGHTLEEQ
uniref:DUF4283 domain-containing protein n=1 Tax=Chenopodium quinoa TaxID=63459 RepID=A0A803MW97_CHEQI